MKGFVVFGLLIYVNDSKGGNDSKGDRKGVQGKDKRSNSYKVLEQLYSESSEYPFLRTPIVSHDNNIIIVSVFGNDVSATDSMFKRILSSEEVKKAELYVFTRIKYYKESIVKDIDSYTGI